MENYYFWLGAEAEEASFQRRFREMWDSCNEGGELIVHGDGSVTENKWKFANLADHYGHDD